MDADKNITATFSEIPIPQFTLTVSVVGQGSVEVNGTAYSAPITVDESTVLSLEAMATAGWQFDGWSGDLVSSNATESITMDADKNITATFSEIPIPQFTLTVSVVGQGSVEVNGTAYTAPITVDEGTVLSLEALATAGWQFDGWSGDLVSSNATESITMDADKNITATFSEIPIPQFTLTVSVVGQGSVEVNGTAYTAPITVDEGTVLNLEALAEDTWSFEYWTINGVEETSNPIDITMDQNIDVISYFEDLTIGINENPLSKIQIFPNPFRNQIVINNMESIERAVISSVIGVIVKDIITNSEASIYIPTDDLAKGLYLITLYDISGQILVKKLIKN
jgi:uncharacterized repeat protein (TIGR02543 family)